MYKSTAQRKLMVKFSDIQYSAERIQKAAEDVFGGRFQVVVSLVCFF